VVFSCWKKITPKNPFSKSLYLLEDFYFIEDDENVDIDTDFCMIAFKNKLESCSYEISDYFDSKTNKHMNNAI